MPTVRMAADIGGVPSSVLAPGAPTMSSLAHHTPNPNPAHAKRLAVGMIGILGLFLLSLLTLPAAAQQAPEISVSDTVMELRLTDGSLVYGRIVATEGDRLTIVTESGGRIEVSRSQIASLRPTTSRLVAGERWGEDPNATRLFFGPTGRAVGRGTGYFAVYELLMPFLSFGVTDRVTISGGTPVIPGAIGELMYFAPKVTVSSRPGLDLAVGTIAFFVPSEDVSLGLLYGVGTFGSRDNAFTLGLGLPFYTGDGDSFGDRVALMIGGEARMTQRTKFITESYFVPGESGGLVIGGVRFFGERLSADAGLGFAVGEESGCCLPVVNFVYSFGRPR
jgi:hypothetical protein